MHFKGFNGFQLVWLYGCVFYLCVTSVVSSLCSHTCFLPSWGVTGTGHRLRQWEQVALPEPPNIWRRIAWVPVNTEQSGVWQGDGKPHLEVRVTVQFYSQSGNHFFINNKYTESCPNRLSSLIPGGDENRLFPDLILRCLWFASSSVCARSQSWGSGPMHKVKHFCQLCSKTTTLHNTGELSVQCLIFQCCRWSKGSAPNGLKNSALPLLAHSVNFLLFTPVYFLFYPKVLCVHTVFWFFFCSVCLCLCGQRSLSLSVWC